MLSTLPSYISDDPRGGSGTPQLHSNAHLAASCNYMTNFNYSANETRSLLVRQTSSSIATTATFTAAAAAATAVTTAATPAAAAAAAAPESAAVNGGRKSFLLEKTLSEEDEGEKAELIVTEERPELAVGCRGGGVSNGGVVSNGGGSVPRTADV